MSDDLRALRATTMAGEGVQARSDRERKPFGSLEQNLAWPPIPGFRLYWFTDKPGRIARAKEAGYEHVLGADGSPVHRVVGRGENGGGEQGYLMKIPVEWYIEDMQAGQAERDRRLAEIREGRMGASAQQNQYVPKTGIHIGLGEGERR